LPFETDSPGHADEDLQLVQAIADGSPEALARLYDRLAPTVFGLARRIVSRAEDAEEVVQDVFAQVWQQAGRYRHGRASVAGWIVMMTRTRAIDRLRARRARPDIDRTVAPAVPTTLVSPSPTPEAAAVSAADAARVREAFRGLSESQRQLLELAYFEGLSHSEMAERTSVPLGTVKTRIRAAMETLRQRMADPT
jgi:RNA polymerase sigma-70 factor (ECF subfamily)